MYQSRPLSSPGTPLAINLVESVEVSLTHFVSDAQYIDGKRIEKRVANEKYL